MTPELNTKHNVHSQVIHTVARAIKVKIPDTLRLHLDKLYAPALVCATRMLKNRADSSSKFYPEIPCVIAKSLVAKYQRNPKCKNITRLVLPICGDRGKQIKSVEGGVRIPALFKKTVLPVQCQIKPQGVIGVDRNSVGNIAVLADPTNGKAVKLGFSPAPTKRCMRGRRANLQKAGAFELLKKIKQKQRRRMTHENHRASRTVVNYAIKHCRAIAIEDLKGVNSKGSKIRKYSESNNWAFAQLETFIVYKAALCGVPVIYINPAYTSQECSRCGNIHKPNGKKFVCGTCSHTAHRDVNAAFNIGQRGQELLVSGGSSTGLNVSVLRSIGGPQTGKDVGTCLT